MEYFAFQWHITEAVSYTHLVKGLTVLELSELVHALEEEFGVSAAAMAAPAAAGAAAPAAEEKTEFDVVLAEVGAEKILSLIHI